LIIFIIEAQIPLPVPVPGVKLGLANAVTLFALFYGMGKAKDTAEPFPCVHGIAGQARNDGGVATGFTVANVLAILLCRIVLGAIFTGRPVAILYSLAGGLLGFAAQVIMKRFVTAKQIWVCGAVGAVFHNIGQIAAAMLITGTPAIVVYLPVLVIAGVSTGALTGFIAQFTLERLPKNS